MNLAELSIKKSVITWTMTILLLVVGYFSYQNLPRLEDPEFAIKQAVVITPYPGASAQEVALRLIALVFCYQIFASSPETTPGRVNLLKQALIAHARRIPPTMGYARAQDNNHLLTEAVGLYTAAAVLPGYPGAARRRKLYRPRRT